MCCCTSVNAGWALHSRHVDCEDEGVSKLGHQGRVPATIVVVVVPTSVPRVMPAAHRPQTYVRPTECPVLDAFCTSLTGISQVQVDAAPGLADALARHHAWLQREGILQDSGELQCRAAAATWSDWDLAVRCLCS